MLEDRLYLELNDINILPMEVESYSFQVYCYFIRIDLASYTDNRLRFN